MPIPKKPQQDLIMTGLREPIAGPETLINRKVWSKKDIKMMVEEDDLHSRKRSNEDYTYSNKLKMTRMNMINTSGFVEVASSYYRKIIWYCAKNIKNLTSYPSFLDSIKYELVEKLREHVYVHPIKFNLKLESTYDISHEDNSAEDRGFKTSARPLFTDTDIEKTVNEEFSCLLMEEDTYMGRGSGFSLEKIDGLLLAVYHHTPI